MSRRFGSAFLARALGAGLGLLLASPAAADQAARDPNAAIAAEAERIEITATRIPEDVDTVPASLTIVTGDDLRARGVRDLRGALALAAGLDIAPGGDGGPAGSVPEFWGLKEFDAFLLVVDGVPWGGAFNPALTSLDMNDVDRIEILRGPAPVMYGATSFVGVIHIIHTPPGEGGATAGASGGSYGSGSLRGSSALPEWGRLRSTVSGGLERTGFLEERTLSDRSLLSWRGQMALPGGSLLKLQTSGFWIRQEPGSPHPRVGDSLITDVPIGANHNPEGSHLDEQRAQLAAGFDRPLDRGAWSTQLSVTRTYQEILRGFLTDVSGASPDANGFRQDIDITDVYLDSHLTFTKSATWRAVAGADLLVGRGDATGGDFDYFVPLDGDNPPRGADIPPASDVRLGDDRSFSGLYAQAEWMPAGRWRLQAGFRLNRTHETRTTRSVEFATPGVTATSDSLTVMRGSGSAGVTFTAWQRGQDLTWIYASYSDTYKPSAFDFGIDSEGDLLAPETAASWQTGLKSRLAGGRFEVEASLFQMDFRNLVVSQEIGGSPALVNAGAERFRGGEVEADWRIREALRWRTSYSLHDARFRDFETEFGGVPTQLAGNRLEMSARNMAATGLVWSPKRGWGGSAEVSYVGSRFLNKRNTALAPAYTTWSAGAAYRGDGWEIRLDGANLNDQRPAVAESELGDAQYYRLPARRVILSALWRFR